MALQVVLLLLVPYALPLLMPSWRWLLAYAAAFVLFVAIWFAIWYYAFIVAPTRTGLEGIGLVLPLSAAISTIAGTIVRMVTLTLKGRLLVVTVSIFGAILLPVAIIVWANR